MRRPDCLFYPDCLTDAANADAPGLACYPCRRYRPTDSLWLHHVEIEGLLRLLLALTAEPD